MKCEVGPGRLGIFVACYALFSVLGIEPQR